LIPTFDGNVGFLIDTIETIDSFDNIDAIAAIDLIDNIDNFWEIIFKYFSTITKI